MACFLSDRAQSASASTSTAFGDVSTGNTPTKHELVWSGKSVRQGPMWLDCLHHEACCSKERGAHRSYKDLACQKRTTQPVNFDCFVRVATDRAQPQVTGAAGRCASGARCASARNSDVAHAETTKTVRLDNIHRLNKHIIALPASVLVYTLWCSTGRAVLHTRSVLLRKLCQIHASAQAIPMQLSYIL